MRKIIVVSILVLTCVISFGACNRARPMLQPSFQIQAKSTSQVRNTIKGVLKRRRWIIKSSGSNHFVARYDRGSKYSATVRIDFSSSKVSIKRIKSSGLLYEKDSEKGEVIHKTYNGWMRNLERDIELELSYK